MTHSMKRRLAAFGAALFLLLFSGCQAGGGGVLVLPDTSNAAAGAKTTWQELLVDAMNQKVGQKQTFLYDKALDETAEKVLELVISGSGSAEEARVMLTENKQTGYATGALGIRNELKLPETDKTRMVSHAIVPQKYAGDVTVWNDAVAAELAPEIIENSCAVSKDPNDPGLPGRVGFAMGKIGTETFVIAWLQ